MYDRLGRLRCGGYRQKDFVVCERCMPDGESDPAKVDASCPLCGGYGEYPVLESRGFSVEEICRWFRVPPSLV